MSDEDFKYLVEEFGSKTLGLLKPKGACPYEYMNNFEKFYEEKLPAKIIFIVLQKMEKSVMMVKYQIVIIANRYLTCEKTWDKLEFKKIWVIITIAI